MKILHVLNTAGVASIIAKNMDRIHGTQSQVITRKCQDKYGHTVYGKYWNYSFYSFLTRIIFEARNHDIIHLHDRDILIPILKKIYPNKPVIIHYHGSKIRYRWTERKKYWRHADQIIVVTQDLLKYAPENVLLVENPVDTELFQLNESQPELSALHMEYGVNDLAKEIAQNRCIPLKIHNRRINPIPYTKMPELLNQYTHYIDVKWGYPEILLYPPDSFSRTGLEALACGLRVISVNQFEAKGLPEENYPEYVAKILYQIYQKLLGFTLDNKDEITNIELGSLVHAQELIVLTTKTESLCGGEKDMGVHTRSFFSL
jgi:glycosyltransferase involved in cell wall biosynthesis